MTPHSLAPARRRRASVLEPLIVAGSLLAGLLAAVAFVASPLAGSDDSSTTAAVLLGFAGGWGLLAVLSARFSDRPQRWAAVPAVATALSGVALIVFAPSAATLDDLGWVWSPLLLVLVAWMIVQARRLPSSRLQPWLLYPVFAGLALAAAGSGYQTVRAAVDGAPAPLAGERLVDVGGHRLAIHCTGSGSPAVVLEPGLGESSAEMARWIAPDVARTTTVCVYDQAGHGHSDPAPARVDAARDLHVLLTRAHVAGPYVLAGHSLGGMFALDYPRRYPAQVAGVVLVDSMHPKQANTFAGVSPLLSLIPTLSRTGVPELLFDRKDGDPGAQARQLGRDIAEMPAVLDRASKLTGLGDRPLAVISAGKGYLDGWPAEQEDLARLSSNTVHRTIAGATHASLVIDQRDAAESGRAIRDIVGAVRRHHA